MHSFVSLGFWWISAILFAGVVVRYFILATLFEMLFASRTEKWTHLYVYASKPDTKQKYFEILWSLLTSVMFAVIGAAMLLLWDYGYTAIYSEFDTFPLWYIPVSIALALVSHETMYYWLHRWMHLPGVFKWVHKVHHKSLSTSSWTAFSFHPIEGLLQLLMVAVIVLFIPLHFIVLLGLLIFMTVSSIINHIGIDLYPKKGNFRKWIIGGKHHAIHHEKFHKNYGLYFTFWDRWMKTESEDLN